MADEYGFIGLKMPGTGTLGGSSTGLTTNNWTSSPSFVGANDSTQQFASAMKSVGPYMAIIGGIGQMFGTYYAAKAQQYQLQSQSLSLEFQRDISQINARQAEFTAQKTLEAGGRAVGALTLKYGKAKGSMRAAMAASGGVIGEGSYQAVEASQDLMKEQDVLTINANTVRSAENARIQAANYGTQATMLGVSSKNAMTSANSIDPYTAASTSLLNSATAISSSLYRDKMIDRLLARNTTY